MPQIPQQFLDCSIYLYRSKESEEQGSSVASDVEKPENFTRESYQDVLKRASRKISSPDEGKS